MADDGWFEMSDEQEVVRTIGNLKKVISWNWWTGYVSGAFTIMVILGIIAFIGLYYNI